MSRRAEAFARVEREVAAEKAAALGRAGERLEAALEETRVLAARFAEATTPAAGAALAAAYARARERARAARMALLVQREALGLRQHRVVDQTFPEPPPRPDVAGSRA